jgi:hypothetical protein
MTISTADRVAANTSESINDEIRWQTEANIARYSQASPEAIEERLAELDHEWDIERCIETMAPIFSLLGLGLGFTVNRRWFALPIVVQSFLLQHAVQGWCPPLPVLRRLGVRSADEIYQERYALMALRGDFGKPPTPTAAAQSQRTRAVIDAVQR